MRIDGPRDVGKSRKKAGSVKSAGAGAKFVIGGASEASGLTGSGPASISNIGALLAVQEVDSPDDAVPESNNTKIKPLMQRKTLRRASSIPHRKITPLQSALHKKRRPVRLLVGNLKHHQEGHQTNLPGSLSPKNVGRRPSALSAARRREAAKPLFP